MTALEARQIDIPPSLLDRIKTVREQYIKFHGRYISENDFLVFLLKIGSTEMRAKLIANDKLIVKEVVLV